jgi:hypothetical protein
MIAIDLTDKALWDAAVSAVGNSLDNEHDCRPECQGCSALIGHDEPHEAGCVYAFLPELSKAFWENEETFPEREPGVITISPGALQLLCGLVWNNNAGGYGPKREDGTQEYECWYCGGLNDAHDEDEPCIWRGGRQLEEYLRSVCAANGLPLEY